MYMRRVSIPLTTDASGDCTAYSAAVSGRVLAVIYTKTNFSNGVDITVSTRSTAQTLMTWTDVNASATVYPRIQVHGATGTGLTLDGTRLMVEPICAADEEIKVVVAQGGNATTGTVTVIIG